MTSYYIELGYQSGYSSQCDPDEAWEELKRVVESLRHDPERITAEARRLGAPETCEASCCRLEEYAEAYADEGLTCFVRDGEERYIGQYASGDRTVKEHVRRAFCRLVIEEMHRRGIEVNLKVT